MIVFPSGHEVIKTNGALYSQKDAVRSMAIMMLVNVAEGNTDMVCDMSEEYKTKDEVEAVFQGLNEVALDMLEDHISDLRLSLEKCLSEIKFTARVRRLDYDKEGKLSDVTVDIAVE